MYAINAKSLTITSDPKNPQTLETLNFTFNEIQTSTPVTFDNLKFSNINGPAISIEIGENIPSLTVSHCTFSNDNESNNQGGISWSGLNVHFGVMSPNGELYISVHLVMEPFTAGR